VAARVRDDIHQVDRPDGTATDGQIFVDDDMEVFVDGDHSGGQYADFDDLTQAEQLALNGAQATWFVLGGPHPDGDFFVNFSAAGWYSLENGPYTQAALTSESLQAGAIVNYEFGFAVFDEVNMAADFLSRRRPLVAGDVLGFNLEFTDYDQLSDTFDAKWSLSGGFNAFRLADRFTDLVLSDLEEPFRPTSIRASTWGQIKSTFDPLKTLY
jgi:hypothetical protein